MPKVTGCGEIEEIERGKVHRIRHHLGKDPATRKYIRSPKRTVHGTKSDVRRALEEYRRELESGFANPDKVTAPSSGGGGTSSASSSRTSRRSRTRPTSASSRRRSGGSRECS